jgi:hypothetical protein
MDQIVTLTEDYIEQGPELRTKLLSRAGELSATCGRNVRLLAGL